MKKNNYIPIIILFLVPILFIYLKNSTNAKDCQECAPNMDTTPGDYQRCFESPIIDISSEAVSRDNYIIIKIDSDSVGTPPYSWSISGTGFHFNNSSGPTTEQTDYPNEELQIWADGSACGSATITVQDECNTATASIRVPTHGKWVLVHDESCGELEPCGGYTWCDCFKCSVVEVGAYKYEDCWVGGNCGYRYNEIGNCSKWPYTEDYSSSNCSCAGYMISFAIKGMWSHKQWEWQCN